MPAEAGINIKVKDDGTLQLKNFEEQVESTFKTTEKSSEGILSRFNKTTQALSQTIKTTGQLALSVLFGYRAFLLFIKSDLFAKISAGALTVVSAFDKTGIATRVLSAGWTKIVSLGSKVAVVFRSIAGAAVAKGAALKTAILPVLGPAVALFGKLRLGVVALAAPLVKLVKYFLTSTAAGKALVAIIRKLQVVLLQLIARIKGSSKVQSIIGGLQQKYSGFYSSVKKGQASLGSVFSKFKSSIKGASGGMGKAAGAAVAGGDKFAAFGKKAGILGKALNIGNKAFAAFITAGPLVQAAVLGVAGAFAALTAATIKFAKAAVEVGRQNEVFTVQYKTLYRSIDKADEKFKMVRKVTASTPFQLDQMIQLNAQLKSTTSGLLDNAQGLQRIADVAAASNQPLEEVGRNVGRVVAGLQYGVPVGMELARLFETGIITPEAKVALSQFSKNGGDATKAMDILYKSLDRFKGGASDVAMTLTGVTSNIKDMNREILSQTGDEMVKPIVYLKKTWLNFITTVQETGVFQEVGVVFAAVINVVSSAVSLLLDPIRIILDLRNQLKAQIMGLLSSVNGLTGGAGRLAKLFKALLKSTLSLRPILFVIKAVLLGIGEALSFTMKFTFGVIQSFGKWIGKFAPIRNFFTWLDGMLGKIAKVAEKVANFIDRFGEKIGAGTLFGTTAEGRSIEDSLDFISIVDKTDELIKSLKEVTEKETVIAKYQKLRLEASKDIQKLKGKVKGTDLVAQSRLDVELKKRLNAISVAEMRELRAIEKKKNEEEKRKLDEQLKAQQALREKAQGLLEKIIGKGTGEEVIRKEGELLKTQLRNLEKESVKTVEEVFGGLVKGLKTIDDVTKTRLKAFRAQQTKSDRLALEASAKAQETEETRLRATTEGYIGAIRENLGMGGVAERRLNEGFVEAATAINVLRDTMGEGFLQGTLGAKSQDLLNMAESNLEKELGILRKRDKNADLEKRLTKVIDSIGIIDYSITAFQDLLSGNIEQGLSGLGGIIGDTMTQVLNVAGPWGQLLSSGFGLIGRVLGSSKERENAERERRLAEIAQNTAKANTYLASVDRNMEKMVNRMEDLFVLPESAYFGSEFSLPELLDREIAAGSTG